jgi:hypothetical protein
MVSAVTRDEILARARSWSELTWYADSANTVAWDSMFNYYATIYGCTDPSHYASDWDAGETYQGTAYSYGGNDDTLSYIEKLEDSLAAGNHMCHYVAYGEETGIYPPDWAAGIDCSAFVCRCWGVPRTSATGIYNSYYHIDKADVEPGDALAWPGHHVILIADPGENPPYGTFALYEASGSACRVWYNPAAPWSSYSSYNAVSLYRPHNSKPDSNDVDPGTDTSKVVCDPPLARGSILLSLPGPPDADAVSFEIFNVLGERVYSGQASGPEFKVSWNGVDQYGHRLPSGVYAVRSIYPQPSRLTRFIFLR